MAHRQMEGDAPAADRPRHLLRLAAADPGRLAAQAGTLADHLAAHPDTPVADLCYTVNTGRPDGEWRAPEEGRWAPEKGRPAPEKGWRAAVVAVTSAELLAGLRAVAAGAPAPGVFTGQEPAGGPTRPAFLFTGHGAQYVHMGRALLETLPTFRRVIDACAAGLADLLPRPLPAVLYPDAGAETTSPLQTGMTYSQPALFAVEVALAAVWRAWGILPAAVAGHSVGEYAAAVAAGIMSLADGLRLVAARGRLMDGLPQQGQMVAVFADEAQVAPLVAPHAGQVAVAVINGPTNVVISGENEAVAAVVAALQAARIRTRPLAVAQASHSPVVDPMLDAFTAVAAAAAFAPPRIPYVSAVTGGWVDATVVSRPAYWRRHQRDTVRFSAAMATLLAAGHHTFVEIGPDATLLGIARRLPVPEGFAPAWLPSLRARADAWETMLGSLAALYVGGADVDWAGFDREYGRRRLDGIPSGA